MRHDEPPLEARPGDDDALPEAQRASKHRDSGSLLFSLVSYSIVWLPVGLTTLLIKFAMLQRGGMGSVGRAMGREGIGASATTDYPVFFTFQEELSFYREDYLLAFLVVPAILFLLIRLFPAKIRIWALFGGCTLLLTLLYVQLQMYFEVGGFLSLRLLEEGTRWVLGHSEDFQSYITPHLTLLGMLYLLHLMVVFFVCSDPPRRMWGKLRPTAQRVIFGGMLAAVFAITTAAWTSGMPENSMQPSVYRLLATELFPRSEQPSRFDTLGAEELREEYRQLAKAPAPGSASRSEYWAVAEDYNVLYFVLETAPVLLLDLDGDLGSFPSFERLRGVSWVASRHYTSSTLTNRSLFSIFTSMYPPASGPVLYEPDLKVPGVIQELKGLGYQTAAYLPATLVLDWEEWMFKAIGFEQMRVADQILDDVPNARKNWKVKKRVDEVSLGALKDDIRHWAAEDQRFAAAYLPQIGHAPWPDILEDGVDRDTRERGREILRLEDRWLGEILDLLDELGMRKRTMIVLAGDHGVRNSFEDPSYDAGRPSERAFHVPLMVSVPGLTEDRRTTGWPTSHIDLAPTLLDLLGIETGREWEQGSPLWEPRLAERTTFYWAHLMEGVRGYRSPEHFALWNGMLDAVYVHQQNTFEDVHQTENSSALYRDVTSRLTAIEELQRAWLRKSLGGTGASRTERSGAQGGEAAN